MKHRLVWIDAARFFAITAVVLGHILGFLTTKVIPAYRIAQDIIVAFNMPLSFILTGYVSLNKISMSSLSELVTYIIRNAMRIMLPWLIFNILLLPFCDYHFSSAFWFLPILFRVQCLIFIPITLFNILDSSVQSKYIQTVIPYAKWLSVAALAYLLGNRTTEFVPYFIVGMIMAKCNFVDTLSKYYVIAGVLVAFILLTWTSKFSFYVSESHALLIHAPHKWVGRELVAILLCIAILYVFKNTGSITSKLCKYGNMTLGIYLIHDYIIECVINKYFHWTLDLTEWGGWIIVIIVWIVTLSVCIGIVMLLSKNKYTALFLLGE